jgi:hypothetical protein
VNLATHTLLTQEATLKLIKDRYGSPTVCRRFAASLSNIAFRESTAASLWRSATPNGPNQFSVRSVFSSNYLGSTCKIVSAMTVGTRIAFSTAKKRDIG